MNFPLQNKKIIITRPELQSAELLNLLKEQRAFPIELPATEIFPIESPKWENILEKISSYEWIIFTSQNAVDFFMKRLMDEKKNISPHTKIACVGEKTAEYLVQEYQVHSHLIPKNGKGSRDLALELIELHKKEIIQSVLFPKAVEARDELIQAFAKEGIPLDTLEVYETLPCQAGKDKFESLFPFHADWILFFSPLGVHSFFHFLDTEEIRTWLFEEGIKIAAIGQTTADALDEHRVPITVISTIPSIEVLIEEVSVFEREDSHV